MAKKHKIQNLRSNVLNKKPLPDELDYGEIGVNYNKYSAALYIKNDKDEIVKVNGEGTGKLNYYTETDNGAYIDYMGYGVDVETNNIDVHTRDLHLNLNEGGLTLNNKRILLEDDLDGKQDIIEDLDTIRSGAAAGATAVQPAALDDKQDVIEDLDTIRSGAAAGATAVQPEALDGKQDVIEDLDTIRSGAAAGATAVQPAALDDKQDKLVSGTNIKTLNNESLLGSGDIATVKDVKVNDSTVVVDNVANITVPTVQTSYGDATNSYINSDGYTDSNKCALSAKNTTIFQGVDGWMEGKLLLRKGRWGDDGFSTIEIPTATQTCNGVLSYIDKLQIDSIPTIKRATGEALEIANGADTKANFLQSKITDIYNELDTKVKDVKVGGKSVTSNNVAEIPLVSTFTDGVMTKEDKVKLNSLNAENTNESIKKTFGELNSSNTYSAKVEVTNGRGALITISYNHNGVGRSLQPKLVWYPKNDGSTPWYQPVAKAWIDPVRGNNPTEYLPYFYGQRTPVLKGSGDIKIWVDFKDEPETYLDLDMVCWINLEASEAELAFDDPNRTMGAPIRIDVPKQLVVFKEDEFNFDCLNNEEREDTFSFYMNGGNLINTLTFLNGYNKPFILIKDASGVYTTQISRYTVGGSGKQEVTFDVKLDATTSNRDCELNLTTQGQTYKIPTHQKIAKLLLGGKVDDVKVNGSSVVTNKVANISLTEYQKSQYKANSITDSNKTSNTYYPTTKAVADYVDPVKAKVDEIELSKVPNLTLFGTPTIQQGQISNFSSTNYAQFPFLVNLNKPFELNVCITTDADVVHSTQQQNIFDSQYGLALAIRDSHFIMAASTNGTSWNLGEYEGNVLNSNTTYYLKFTWDGLTYELKTSTDKINYTTEIVFADSASLYPKQIVIGKSDFNNANIFKGIINLNECNLIVGDVEVWRGMDSVGLATRLATNLNNIDNEGEERIKSIANSNEWYGTQAEFDALTEYQEGVNYFIYDDGNNPMLTNYMLNDMAVYSPEDFNDGVVVMETFDAPLDETITEMEVQDDKEIN